MPLVTTDRGGAAVTAAANYLAPGFPGQSRVLADLYYNRYRDYDPTTGRYIQADPIGLAGGANGYLYAGGNPVNWVDPMGLAPVCNHTSRAVLVGGTAGYGHGHPKSGDRWAQIYLQPGQCVSKWEPRNAVDAQGNPCTLADIDTIDYNRDGIVKWPGTKGDRWPD